jgi:Rieske Fe-S protein
LTDDSGGETAVTHRSAPEPVSRRSLAALAGVSAIGLPLLAACGGSDSVGSDPGSASRSAGAELATTSQIPVGGGRVILSEHVVVTQPTAGEFKGFSSFCTHQSCQVSRVESGTIQCPCHGSMYSIVDGSVQSGPAPRPLPGVKLSVQGDQISLA